MTTTKLTREAKVTFRLHPHERQELERAAEAEFGPVHGAVSLFIRRVLLNAAQRRLSRATAD